MSSNTESDSLMKELHTASYDSNKTKICNKLAGYYYDRDLDSLYKYANLTLYYASENSQTRYQGNAYSYFGRYYAFREKIELAYENFNYALEIYKSTNDTVNILNSYINLGLIFKHQALYTKSYEFMYKVLTIAESRQDTGSMFSAYINLGNLHNRMKDYDKALETYRLAKDLLTNEALEKEINLMHNNIGMTMFYKKEYAKAIESFRKGEQVRIKYDKNNNEDFYYNNIGECFKAAKQYDSAFFYYRKAVSIRKTRKIPYPLINSYTNLADLFLEVKNYDSSYFYAKKANEMAKEIHNPELILSTSLILEKINIRNGDYKNAYYALKEAKEINDTMQTATKESEIVRLELEHKFDKIQRTNEHNYAIEMEKEKWLTYFFVLVSALFLIFLIILLVNFRRIHKAHKILQINQEKIKTQKEEIERTNVNLNELQEYKDRMTNMLVHDLKNSLYAIISFSSQENIHIFSKHIAGSARQMLNMVLNILDVQKAETTKINVEFFNFPILMAVNAAIEQIEYLADEKNIKLHLDINDSLFVDYDKDLMSRVFVNIISNSLKYSDYNTNIYISAANIDGNINIKIRDEGYGIEKEMLEKVFEKNICGNNTGNQSIRSTGLGLTFCKLAVEAHKGSISIESEVNVGTTITIVIPATAQIS
jgi:signal transduction histidine kinase